MLRLLRNIFCFWLLLMFLFTGALVFPFFWLSFKLLKGEREAWTTLYITKFWGFLLGLLSAHWIQIRGKEKIDPKERYVMVSNHLSMMDIPVCAAAAPMPFSYLAKWGVRKIPVVGFVSHYRDVFVDRRSPESRKASMLKLQKYLEEQRSIHLFIEGTRNVSDEPLQAFHNGAFNLAVDSQQPIAVLTIINTDKILSSKKKFQAGPGLCWGVWSDPIPTQGKSRADIPALKEEVRQKMLATLKEFGRA